MTFEELIKNIQKDSGLTQADFADSIQISRKTFFNWVKGKYLPLETDTVLQIISDVYNKPMPVLSKALQKSKEQRMLGTNTVDMEQISKDNIDSILIGDERTVINTITKIFEKEYSDLSSEQRGYCRLLIKNSILVAKRLCGDDVTFKDLETIVWNINGNGKFYYIEGLELLMNGCTGNFDIKTLKENSELIYWFLDYYYNKNTNNTIWNNTITIRNFFNDIAYKFDLTSKQHIPPVIKEYVPMWLKYKNQGFDINKIPIDVDEDDNLFAYLIDRPQIDMSLPFDENM